MHNFTFTTAAVALPKLAAAVMEGPEVGSRNGRTRELTHVNIELTEPWKREIVTPDRRASYPAQIAETMWLLAGRDDIAWLSHYLPRAADFSDDGETWRGAYGKRIRSWTGHNGQIDQLAHVYDLLRNDPATRRAVVSIYSPSQDSAPGKDIPCNNQLHFLSRLGYLDLRVTIRSNDLIWGWSGINAFEWSAVQEILAGMLGMKVGVLVFNTSSLHVYEKHWGRAEKLADTWPSVSPWAGLDAGPRFNFPHLEGIAGLDDLVKWWFKIEAGLREEPGNPQNDFDVAKFPEPMMRSWLRVLQAWWLNDSSPHGLSTGQVKAYFASPARKTEAPLLKDEFTEFVVNLHAEKSAAYGDSWKRRGEMLAILANVARKVDRLGGAGGAGETLADTAIDLLVYLVKYRLWLVENGNAPAPMTNLTGPELDADHNVAVMLRGLSRGNDHPSLDEAQVRSVLAQQFEALVSRAQADYPRHQEVDHMISLSNRLARQLWHKEQNQTRAWGGYGDA